MLDGTLCMCSMRGHAIQCHAMRNTSNLMSKLLSEARPSFLPFN